MYIDRSRGLFKISTSNEWGEKFLFSFKHKVAIHTNNFFLDTPFFETYSIINYCITSSSFRLSCQHVNITSFGNIYQILLFYYNRTTVHDLLYSKSFIKIAWCYFENITVFKLKNSAIALFIIWTSKTIPNQQTVSKRKIRSAARQKSGWYKNITEYIHR